MTRIFHIITFVLFVVGITHAQAQALRSCGELHPTEDYDNIHVQRLDDDQLATTYMIWVKKAVKEHYHEQHTEVVYVIEGEGKMKLNDDWKAMKAGDYIFIPKGTHHAVEVTSSSPMKVISIQTPQFDGSDRVFVSQE